VVEDGRVHDTLRMQFLHEYIAAMGHALKEGVPIGGYFVWSLLDNFEWAEGFRPRFGLVRVDYDTLERIPKDSAFMYRDIIQANAI
jgi:beta-glucosidase